MEWWLKNNHRLIQTNIRETDADLDVPKLIHSLKALSANVLMLGTGGITAFYPTKLPYQKRSPWLKGDLIGSAVKACHENGIRFIARFDFSKVHDGLLTEHPDWMYRSKNGERIRHEGLVSTCINGEYQQERIYEILAEVLDTYPVDGIFMNMFGYITSDYSNHNYGICHCEGCKRRFMERYGHALPERQDPEDAVYRDYLAFQKQTVQEMLEKIHALVKGKNPGIAISTYSEYKVDMVRKESNTELYRALPFWLYSASENVQSLEDGWEDRVVSNCSINAAGIDYRFMGVSKHQVAVRLYESIASGSGLDCCIIGPFEGYPDGDNLGTIADIYRFHKEHEDDYGHFASAAQVALLKPARFSRKEQEQEYHGLYKILKESHIPFDVIRTDALCQGSEALLEKKLLLIPDIRALAPQELSALELLHGAGVNLIATGESFSEAGQGDFLKAVFGAAYRKAGTPLRGAYLDASDKALFHRFPKRDWVLMDGAFSMMDFEAGVQTALPLISPGIYGPPEKCGGNFPTGDFAAAIKNGSAILPWGPGRLYYCYGYEDHKNLLLDILDRVRDFTPVLQTNAPACAEVFFNRLLDENGGDRGYILQLLNLSGFNGMTFFEPLPLRDITVTLSGIGAPKRIVSLSGAAFTHTCDGENLTVTLGELTQYEAIVIEYGQEEAK